MTVTSRHTTVLPATPPYRLSASLRALRGFAPCAGDQCFVGTTVRKAFALPGSPDAVIAEVSARPDDVPGVALALYAARALTPAEATAVELAVARWLGLDDDVRPFLELAADDPAMDPLLAETAGLHQVRFASLSEGACYFMLTQRTSQTVAGGRKRRIAADLGARLDLDGEPYPAFPQLEAVAETPVDLLAGYAGGAARAARLSGALRGLWELVADRGEAWLYQAPYDDVLRSLLGIHGIGDFTAHAILLRVLGRPDEVPLEMAQFADVVAAVYGPGTPVDTVRRRYGEQVGWWSYFAKTALGWAGTATTHRTARRRTA